MQKILSVLQPFKWALLSSVIVLACVAIITKDPGLIAITATLAILELGLSFDNAVVNAGTLKKMDKKWQDRFLLWGILIAVFGMRLVIPVLIVALFGQLTPWDALFLAFNDGKQYGEILHRAHFEIAGFGGMFLAMVFLNFILEDRDIKWLAWIERPLAKLGQLKSFATLTGIGLVFTVPLLAPAAHRLGTTLAMLSGLVIYLAVDMLADKMETDAKKQTAKGIAKTGLASFIYLEVLDASFSFDGVIGAFAITTNIVVIMAGLGIGAFFVRSLTVFLVRGGHLDELPHLEHAAHYAIGVLAAIMFFGMAIEIPEFVTGLAGALLIALGIYTSRRHNAKNK